METAQFSPQDRLLRQAEAAEYLGVTPRFLEMRRFRGEAPPFVRLSSRCVRYSLRDLQTFVEERRELGADGIAA